MLLKGLVSATNGMQALLDMNDTTANNVANVNTVGYKKANLIFQDIYNSSVIEKTGDPKSGDVRNVGELSVGSRVQKLTYDFSQGALNQTNNPFDMAIEGDGFFKIQSSSNGDISYTRNGSFTINHNSFLVTKDGDYVLDNESKRIQINTDNKKMRSNRDIVVTEKGQIQINHEANQTMLQTIGVYDFKNKEDMDCVGASKFKPTDIKTNPEVKPDKFIVQQGSLEMSNANVVNEMIRTINTSRNYETLSKVVKSSNDSLERAIQVGRIKG